jgi:hypothetical protein
MSDTQQHPLANGLKVQISRNGRHQYWIGDDGPKMKSVTSMLKHIEGDTFGIGMNWALKLVRENNGNINAPRQVSKESVDVGNRLHEAIDQYIRNHVVTELDPLFLAWFNKVGESNDWMASELFVYNPALEPHYGGTVDAISMDNKAEVVIWDWKTKERESYEKYGGYLHEQAQLAAYADALVAMGSAYAPTKGCIAYIMRDGSYVDVVEVDLQRGSKLFNASRELFLLTQGSE